MILILDGGCTKHDWVSSATPLTIKCCFAHGRSHDLRAAARNWSGESALHTHPTISGTRNIHYSRPARRNNFPPNYFLTSKSTSCFTGLDRTPRYHQAIGRRQQDLKANGAAAAREKYQEKISLPARSPLGVALMRNLLEAAALTEEEQLQLRTVAAE